MSLQEKEQLWGGETTKAVANFPVSGETVPVPVIRWLAQIKAAAARVNAELGLLEPDLAQRIAAARAGRRDVASATVAATPAWRTCRLFKPRTRT